MKKEFFECPFDQISAEIKIKGVKSRILKVAENTPMEEFVEREHKPCLVEVVRKEINDKTFAYSGVDTCKRCGRRFSFNLERLPKSE